MKVALPAREVIEGKARFAGRTLAEWVPEVTERVVGACAPLRVVLFGSVARGDDGPDSDIDLLVVVGDDADLHATARAAVRAVADLAPEVEPVVISRSAAEVNRHVPGTVVRPAVREGRIVYERGR